MKRPFLILFLSVFFFACVPEDHVLEIEVVNNTAESVRDLSLSTAGDRVSFEADELAPGQKIDHTLQVPENSADGNFTFSFSRSDGEQVSTSGNYTDGEDGPLKKILVFEIVDEGVNVRQEVLEVE